MTKQLVAATRTSADRAPEGVQRTRKSSLGGARLRLEVLGTLPGFHLYWANDEDAAIEMLLDEGFEFVTKGELGTNRGVVADEDVDSRISKVVGKQADGSPLRAYLMKCDEAIWQEREESIQEVADSRDSAIREGTISAPDSSYKPRGADIKLDHKVTLG